MNKIAIVTDDHQTISAHFGRAIFYEVFTVEDGKIISREARPKPNHNHFIDEPHEEHGQQHGMGPAADSRHKSMVGVIQDCQILLARGMGMGAFDSLKSHGIQPVMTDIQDIEKAVEAHIKGELIDHPERLH